MPANRGRPPDPWGTCVALSESVLRVHDQVSYARERRLSRYDRLFGVPTAEGLSRVLLALVLHSLSQDAVATTGRPLTTADLRDLRLADVVAVLAVRPSHELFAGLESAAMSDADRARVNAVALLSYDAVAGSALILPRLRAGLRIVLRRLIDRYPGRDLTFSDLTWLDTAPLPPDDPD